MHGLNGKADCCPRRDFVLAQRNVGFFRERRPHIHDFRARAHHVDDVTDLQRLVDSVNVQFGAEMFALVRLRSKLQSSLAFR